MCVCVEYGEKATNMVCLMHVCVEEDTCVCVCVEYDEKATKMVSLMRVCGGGYVCVYVWSI